MIKISAQDLDQGIKMAQLVAQCPDALVCLWGGKECKKNCGLPTFRRIFERNSPAFFGLFRRLSEFDAILHDLALTEVEGDPDQKHEAHERFHDLQTFAQTSIVVLYPLFSANNEEVPFLRIKEIEEVEQAYLEADPEKARDELEQINSEWWNRLVAISNNFCDMKSCSRKWYLLARIFLKGVEKFGPPRQFLSKEEKAGFFEELESFIFSK